ncbi:hypothetical protein RFY44_16665 [Acinetobacter bereziniae]|uniref:hypothetical protein n=1 Tax=Acinetobacter bereziniae TaxID=106648 RepID=UPI0028148C9C|nr:hypothetical protein [Acinetobacter bereziniae]MDQ9820486.1 hypothetical protein [Acinetobacter bereziniae]
MTAQSLNEAELSEIALRALINSLHLQGYNLDNILQEYSSKIQDNQLSGADATHKFQTIELLKTLIDEAKNNQELNK